VSGAILGSAWPALLAPGLRVLSDTGESGVVIDYDDRAWRTYWPASHQFTWESTGEGLSVDYAHPATRDAVCRALGARTHHDDTTTPAYRHALAAACAGRDEDGVALRAVTAAVWGVR